MRSCKQQVLHTDLYFYTDFNHLLSDVSLSKDMAEQEKDHHHTAGNVTRNTNDKKTGYIIVYLLKVKSTVV